MGDTTQAYPLQWPIGVARTPRTDRKEARFGKRNAQGYGNQALTIAEARSRVLAELDKVTPPGKPWRVPPDSIVISTNVQTRGDGLPYSGAKDPDDPGVCVYFTIDGEDRCAPCDKWDRVADNLAAIAKTVEADRGKERWGVSSIVDSYRRPALPSPGEAGGTSWQRTLGLGQVPTNDEIIDAYRRLRSKYHPDKPDGDVNAFNQVQKAFEQARRERGL